MIQSYIRNQHSEIMIEVCFIICISYEFLEHHEHYMKFFNVNNFVVYI